jgi:hypothetical protein
MDREKLILLVTYGTYSNDREDISNLCDAANKISNAISEEPLCRGSLGDFTNTVDNMIAKGKISDGENGLSVKDSVYIDEATPKELYFINKVRPTDVQAAVVSE